MMIAIPTPVTLDTTLLVVRAELVEQVQCGQETLQCATVRVTDTHTLCFEFLFSVSTASDHSILVVILIWRFGEFYS